MVFEENGSEAEPKVYGRGYKYGEEYKRYRA